MDHLLSIIYPNGRMAIYMDRFFPASPARLRKLLRVVDMADDSDELRKQAAGFCRARAEELLKVRPSYAQAAVSDRARAAELQNDIDRQQARLDTLAQYKVPKEALKRGREKLRDLKTQQRVAMAGFRDNRRQYVSIEKEAKRLMENAEEIEL